MTCTPRSRTGWICERTLYGDAQPLICQWFVSEPPREVARGTRGPSYESRQMVLPAAGLVAKEATRPLDQIVTDQISSTNTNCEAVHQTIGKHAPFDRRNEGFVAS
jgi:hypothetical protein